jgi:dTDP-4-dehydrorhamnose 3,5-epimerase
MEDKLVACVRGAIFDVMVDIRPSSPTFGRWFGCELSESNRLQLHSARGFAHGFQTLTDDCLIAYHISQFYDPDRSAGIRWDDPDIGIVWPRPPVELSPRDQALPLLREVDPKLLVSPEISTP